MPEAFDETVERSLLLDESSDPIREGLSVGAGFSPGLGPFGAHLGANVAEVREVESGESYTDRHDRDRLLRQREAGPLVARRFIVLATSHCRLRYA